VALAPAALAQTQRDWSGQQPVRYADPDVIALDKRFQKYKIDNTTIQRLWTGALWAEGPAWNGAGRYLVWSDLPNNRQMRWLEEDGHISVFRSPSEYSNGNTFDFEGRQVSCQHGPRCVVRFESDGATTVIADKWQGKPLNSPNDLVVHPDGAVWFTDPPYGILGYYEGFQAKPEIKEAVYRVEPKTGKMDKVTDELDKPNGICFSPDYKKVYICDTGDPKDIQVFDVVDGKSLRN
jgi:gluconolactonase